MVWLLFINWLKPQFIVNVQCSNHLCISAGFVGIEPELHDHLDNAGALLQRTLQLNL